MVKSLPAIQETQVQSQDREDLLEKEMATHSSTLTWRIPWTEEPGGLQSTESQRVGYDLATEHACKRFINKGRFWRIQVGSQKALPQELSGPHFYNQRSGEREKTTLFLFLCKDVLGKWCTRGWSCPRSQVSSWDRPPIEVLGFTQERIQERAIVKWKR